jgi:Ca-activated chloride channel homolog
MNEVVPSLRTAPDAIARAPSPLSATVIAVEITDLLATLTLEQRYANQESVAIEVSYTLALPLEATLLDVEVEIGGRRLRGRVQPRVQAEASYEQALAEGHSAFSIRMVDDQLLNIALGNLLPGEELVLRIVMAQWLRWNGDRVRLTLPTTVAPRYGQCQLQPVDQPQVELLAEHQFRLSGRVRGLLASAELACASHCLAVRAVGGGIDFSIDRGLLDRDIVIDLRAGAQALRVAGTIAADLPGQDAAMIAFCAHSSAGKLRPVIAELVLDCSGSMAGMSIEQTRVAVRAIVGQLGPSDRINVLRFGSSRQLLLRRPQSATLPVQRTVLQGADTLQADLGGTELLAALEAGLDDLARVPRDSAAERVLFVISDGEVWNLDAEPFLQRCAREQVRVFAVAVGSAAVEATFAPLTRGTGGALERVLPGEAMAERIARHFARVRSGALRELRVRWPGSTLWTQGPTEVYPGDGTILSAGMAALNADSKAEISWIEADGAAHHQWVALQRTGSADAPAPSTLARMLARTRVAQASEPATATRLAVDYQLITEHSAITLVLERDAAHQLDQLPPLRVVSQMLAAGWGGSAVAQPSAVLPVPAPAPIDLPRSDFDMAPVCKSPAPMPRMRAAPGAAAGSGAAPKGLRRVAEKMTRLWSGQQDEREESSVSASHATDEARYFNEIAAHLLRAFREHPELLVDHARAQLSLSRLALELPPTLFNWLDERAEARQQDLESGAFWAELIVELCGSASGKALRSLLKT